MTKTTPPEWHAKAKEYRAQGLDPTTIAHLLSKTRSQVLWVLNENGEREKHRQRLTRQREAMREQLRREASIEARRPARSTRIERPRIDTMEIARLFAAGEIDRSELSRRLRGDHLSEISA